ncbi:hypothetical protein L1987_15367 [Smallanthus sonchifolius]|uniref:Uncharacterized protein n=1 Tax=Smallanthus sonchifolius TaxID=185202 RepID=A0ACB9J7N1_9ASTR|nr:hypothetical protein L1987_15367 [Smallanthus sonchifolius]
MFAPFVRLLLWFFFPIAYSISKVLDWMSGKGHAALLRRKELKTFVDFHGNEENGHRVMSVAPPYDQYKDAWDTEVEIELKAEDKTEKVRFFHCYKRGVDRVFIDHLMFLEKVWGKNAPTIYGPVAGTDYLDNQIRFSLLCRASLEAPRVLNLNSSEYFSGPYGEDVVFIANDWHTALLPCYLKNMYQTRGLYMSAKVAFCIHNIAYQGRFAFADFELLNLQDEFKSSFDFMDGYEKPVKGRKINSMKAGILELDKILTVSPYYAEELVSGPDKGVMSAKPLIKEALQAEVSLPVDKNIPVIGFIGRLEEQKGSDILAAAIPKFIGENGGELPAEAGVGFATQVIALELVALFSCLAYCS